MNERHNNPTLPSKYTTGQYPAVRDDEIDLKELVLGLWAERWLIVVITSAVAAIALTYALMATPYYKTQATLKPAPEANFTEFNNTMVASVDSEQAFQQTLYFLDSLALKKRFFFENELLFKSYYEGRSPENAFSIFLKNGFVVSLPDEKRDKGKGSFVKVSLEAPSSVSGSEVVDRYIDYVLSSVRDRINAQYKLAKASLLKELNSRLKTKSTLLENGIQAEIAQLEEADEIRLKELNDQKAAIVIELELKRKNRIELLKENLSIAKKMGIENPQTISSFAARESSSGALLAEINSGAQPLFLMGARALTAEIEALSARKDEYIADSRFAEITRQIKELESNRKVDALLDRIGDERFFADISAIKTEIHRVKSLPESFDDMQIIEILDPAYTDPQKTKPKRALICILGAVIGGFLAVFFALLKRLFTN